MTADVPGLIDEQITTNGANQINGDKLNAVLKDVTQAGTAIINVNNINTKAEAYEDAATARAAVPESMRKAGAKITYLLEAGWMEDQFNGADISGWDTASNWKTTGPVSVSQNTQTGKTELLIGNTPALIVDNEPEAGSDNLVKSGGVDKMFGIDRDVNIEVESGVELIETLQIGANKGVTYLITLIATSLIDSNGINVYFANGGTPVASALIGNGSTIEITPDADCDHITLSRYGTGVIGTGEIHLKIRSKIGLIPIIDDIQSDIDDIQSDIDDIQSDIDDIQSDIDDIITTVGIEKNINVDVVTGTELSEVIPLSLKKNVTYNILLAPTPYIDANGINIVLRKGNTAIISTTVRNGATISVTPNDDIDSILLARYGTGIIGTGTISLRIESSTGVINDLKKLQAVAYISPSGNDNNDGSAAYPLLTINKALEKGFSTILVNAGVYSQSNIDLSLTKSSNIKIAALPNAYVIFYPKSGDYTRIETETKTNGYTNVYQTSINSVSNNLKFAWQDGVDDIRTLISDAERHPLQRGKEYRLDSTMIIKCSSSSLQDALDEIDNITDNIYRYFFDSSNSILYYSRPENVDSSHPICIPIADKTFIKEGNANNGKTLELVGIDVRYVPINITGMISPRIINCSAKYAYAYGGIMWFNSKGTYIERCEAAGTQNGPNGDGFNASSGGNYPAHNTSALLIDCWAHDNNDDGYSCHQRCEGILQGGLFEYNKKGGVTPAYGEKHLCYNVLSRRNHNGFYYTGTADDGGKYGQAICFGCVSKNNSQVGFRCDGTGNKLIVIGCKSISDVTSYKTPDANSSIELTDCSSSGATTIKSGNIVVTNTTLVE